jgi:hypothetical protein
MKKFILWTSGIILLAFLLYFAICSYTYSTGTRTGFLIKFSEKGWVFKTFEGDMNAGVLNTNMAGFTANLWHFSVPSSNKEAIQNLQDLEGKQIKIFEVMDIF